MDPAEATRILGKANEMGDRTMSNFREAGYPVPEKGCITSLADIDKLVASTPEQRAADVLSRQHGGVGGEITSAEGEASVRPGDLTPSQTIEPGAGGPMINRAAPRVSPPASPAEDALNELIQKHGAGLPEVESAEGEASVRPKDLTPSQTVESTAGPVQPKLPKSPYEEALTKIHNGETPTPAPDEAAAEVSPAEEALQQAAKPAEEPTMNPEAEAASEPATEQQPEPEDAPAAAPEEPAKEPAKTPPTVMRFNGKSADGTVEGSLPVEVVNPHSNAAAVTTTKGGRSYEADGSRHLPTATVRNPRTGKVFEAFEHSLTPEADAGAASATEPVVLRGPQERPAPRQEGRTPGQVQVRCAC